MLFTHSLLFLRSSIIVWSVLAFAPLECMFDAIEHELEKQGVHF